MQPSVITLGTFDGLHLGHRALLRAVKKRAKALKARSVVLAFGRPPRHADLPWQEPVLLTTLEEKLEILRQMGIDQVKVLVFDRKTASTPPERFFKQAIVGTFRAKEMIVGPRVAFGKNRAGRLPLLRRLGRAYGVGIRVIHPVRGADVDVSSRRIRRFLRQGNLQKANALLGYRYSAAGRVVHGRGHGRRLGFPTANLAIPSDKILPPGVYWVKVFSTQGRKSGQDGLCNVGTRPTFMPRSHDVHCEVFLMGRTAALYGKKLRVVFMKKIRAEKRFESPQALVSQIRRDESVAQRWSKRFSLQNKLVSI